MKFRYKLPVEKVLSKGHMKKYYEIVEISNDKFIIDFKAQAYQQAKQLAGKYVVCTNLKTEKMDKTQVRQQYKNLQKVEHAFRDLKRPFPKFRTRVIIHSATGKASKGPKGPLFYLSGMVFF